MKKYIIILLVLLFIPSVSFSAPSISSVSGTMTNGSTVTITGTGFEPSATNDTPFAYSDMENNSLAARIGTNWTDYGYPSGHTLSVSSAHNRHANSSYNAIGTFDTANQFIAFRQESASSAKWYAQYWVYVDSAFTFASGNIKLIRFWISSDNNLRIQAPINNADIVVEGRDTSHGGYSSNCSSGGWTPVITGTQTVDQVLGHACGGEVLPGSVGWHNYTSDIKDGSWHLMQFEMGTSHLKWWFDGKLILSSTTINTTGNYEPYHIGWYRDSTSDGTGSVYFDDVYIDNTWARVEIGNASTYNACTVREIQPPVSRTSTEVQITLNAGSLDFTDETSEYLYLVDSDGTVSSGYEITSGGDSTSPAVTISDSDPKSVAASTTTLTGTSSDANGVDECKWRSGSAPDESNGTACTGTTSWSCSVTGLSEGANTIYVGCADPTNNWGSDSITVNADTIAPTFVSATINGQTAVINLSEDVGITFLDNGDFTMTGSTSGTIPINSCTESAGVLSCTAAAAFIYNETVTASYNGSANEVEDLLGNDLAIFSGESVTNNTPPVANPGVVGISGSGTQATINGNGTAVIFQ